MDIYMKMVMDVFYVVEDEVIFVMRCQVKVVNFGIVYGISDYGLLQNFGIIWKEVGVFID